MSILMNKKILVFSAGRTGSTVVWQSLREIAPKAEKIHTVEMVDYLSDSLDCIIVERDPVTSFLSYVRCEVFDGNTQRFLECIAATPLTDLVNIYKGKLSAVEYVKEKYKGRTLLLHYDDFNNNYDYLFSQFEKFLNISIDEADRKKIIKKTDRNSNLKIQSTLTDFNSTDLDSSIHGNHIATFSEDQYDFINLENQAILRKALVYKGCPSSYPIKPEHMLKPILKFNKQEQ